MPGASRRCARSSPGSLPLCPFLPWPVAAVLGGNTAATLLLIGNVAVLVQLYDAQGLAAKLLGATMPRIGPCGLWRYVSAHALSVRNVPE